MVFEKLLSQGNIGKLNLKNRVVMPAMMLGHGQFDGTPTKQMRDYYEERAKGDVGLIITEIARVNDFHGVGAFAQLAVSKDYQIDPLRQMIDSIHKHDCKLIVQLHHAGYQAEPLTVGLLPLSIQMDRWFSWYKGLFYNIAPKARILAEKGVVLSTVSPSKVEPNRFTRARNRALTLKEIHNLQMEFIEGAGRVKMAGGDGVELHAAHGYLLQQFLSPRTNQREDQYGGSAENRVRFITEILQGIKAACGMDFPVIVRLTADECYSEIGEKGKGYDLVEGVHIAKLLEEAGADAIHVSSGNYETMNYWLEPTSFKTGWRKHLAKAVKDNVKIPVIAANVIRSPEQAEDQISEGYQDFVALGRPHIADPHWTLKVIEGRQDEIKRCISCLWCFESMMDNAYHGEAGQCAINPFMGRERERDKIRVDGRGRLVMIVGAGPSGLASAEILAERGFEVHIYDKEDHIGGQLYLAAQPPGKEKLSWCFEDLLTACKKRNVQVHLKQEVMEDLIDEMNPYAVIIATGGQSVMPSRITGIHEPHVLYPEDVLKRKEKIRNQAVIVIGSGMTGLETAEALAVKNNKVTVVEMSDRIAPTAYFQHVDDVLPKLEALDVCLKTSQELYEITSDGVRIKHTKTGELESLKADKVVLSLGVKPNRRLYDKLVDRGIDVHLIGDANRVGRVGQAIREGVDLAMALK